jgi:hypothetical protein
VTQDTDLWQLPLSRERAREIIKLAKRWRKKARVKSEALSKLQDLVRGLKRYERTVAYLWSDKVKNWQATFPTRKKPHKLRQKAMSEREFRYVILLLVLALGTAFSLLLPGCADLRQKAEQYQAEQQSNRDNLDSQMQRMVGKTIADISGPENPIMVTFDDGSTITIESYKYSMTVTVLEAPSGT